MSTVNEQQIRSLMEAVDRADRAGNNVEAERVLSRAIELAPDHPGVRNAAGMRALGRGELDRALSLLQGAARLDPGDPLLRVNVALAQRKLGNEAAERDALEQALGIDPRYFPALLHKARLLERQGKISAASYTYNMFLSSLPAGEHPPAVQEAVTHAHRVIRENFSDLEKFLEPRLHAARTKHASEYLERFDACLEMILGKRQTYRPEPTFMLYPKIPAIEFLDRSHYPWLSEFDAATPEIRAEALSALSDAGDDFVPYISRPVGAPLDQWLQLNNSKRWSTYFLMKNGKSIDAHMARCPRTAALLKAAPLCQIPDHAPTAFFSVLAPRTTIPPHTGVTNTRFIVHLPLVVPPDCMYRVGAEKRPWQEGNAWVFDDTFEHEAVNNSDLPRIVLIFDVWNCFLTDAERDLVAAVTAGINEFNHGESPFRQGG